MSWTIDATGWTKQAFPPIHDGKYPSQLRPEGVSAVSMNLNLSTAGRLGFFIDYSERETVGDHTFYVARTHGTQGTVGCTWTAYDSADGTELASDTVYWNPNSADIKSFTVNVPSKPAGDHRIYVLLSNATGGAVLHHGEHTVAYGIIDDDTIATSNAIFLDMDAATDGDGTQGNPFNSWFSARAAVTPSLRFLYIKGMLEPLDDLQAMSQVVNHIALRDTFEGRFSESQRLVIRNWPGFVGGIDGNGQTNCAGFVCDGGSSTTGEVKYITFRKLLGTNLNTSSGTTGGGKCYFLRTRGGTDMVGHFTAEHITIDGIVSGANAATAVWYSETCTHLKLWRWDSKNTSHHNIDQRLINLQLYRTDMVSVQRCTFHETSGGIYEKEGISNRNTVGITARFNIFTNSDARFGTQGGVQMQDFHIVQNNVFISLNDTYTQIPVRFYVSGDKTISTRNVVSNNVFHGYDHPTIGAVYVDTAGFEGVCIYNNIFYDVKRAYRFDEGSDTPLFIDYNHYENPNKDPVVMTIGALSDLSLTGIQQQTSFSDNASTGSPVFNDAANGDYTLQLGSIPTTGGSGGAPQGIYIGDFVKIGAAA